MPGRASTFIPVITRSDGKNLLWEHCQWTAYSGHSPRTSVFTTSYSRALGGGAVPAETIRPGLTRKSNARGGLPGACCFLAQFELGIEICFRRLLISIDAMASGDWV